MFAAQAQQQTSCVVLQNASAAPGTNEAPAPVYNNTNCSSIQNVRVNVHFVQYDNGTGNFTAFDDGRPGNPGTAMTGYRYAQELIWAANGQWSNNTALTIAPGNTLAPLPKRIRLVLTGVYFDRSTRYRGLWGTEYVEDDTRLRPPVGTEADYPNLTPLCVNKDSVINIFMMEQRDWPYTGGPGSPPTSSQTPAIGVGNGYAFGVPTCATQSTPNALYLGIGSPWTAYIQQNVQPWQAASVLNHEIAHTLGLQRTWLGASGCADAPANAKYWNLNSPTNNPACTNPANVSNNMMDYNACQCALSPCQIGKMQDNLNTCLSRYVIRCGTCLPTYANFELPASTCGSTKNIWLDGRATWANNSFRLEIDRYDARGVLDPASHFETTFWRAVVREQLDVLYTFAPNSNYRVKLVTYNNCGSSSVRVRNMTTTITAADCSITAARATAPVPSSSTVSTVR